MTIDEKAAYASMSWQRFNREISDDLARAIVSAFALVAVADGDLAESEICLLYTSPSPRDQRGSRMPSSA